MGCLVTDGTVLPASGVTASVASDELKNNGPDELHFQYLEAWNEKTDEKNALDRVRIISYSLPYLMAT